MVARYYQPVNGPGNLPYGCEWRLDDFDRYIDRLLERKLEDVPRHPLRPRIAIDIGCGFLKRASFLATTDLFDRIIAIDFEDRTSHVAQAYRGAAMLLRDERSPAPISFKESNVTALQPDMFSDAEVAFVNCRRVGHFLSPQDFRKALGTIYGIAAPGALVALSFDKPSGEDKGCSIWGLEGRAFYERRKPGTPAYAPYRNEDVAAYMAATGFRIESHKIPEHLGDMRGEETHIIARIPNQKGPRPVPQMAMPAQG